MFRRTFDCGHPDEFVEVRSLGDCAKLHNLVTFEVFKQDGVINQPTYTKARCLNCAKKAKREDDNDPSLRPKRSLGAYMTGTSSTYTRRSYANIQDGFERALERNRNSSLEFMTAKPHEHVSEVEHRAHYLDIQEEAVACPRKWLAVPARRVRNVPIRAMGENGLATRNRDTSCSSESNDLANDTTHIRQKISQCNANEQHSENVDSSYSPPEPKVNHSMAIEHTVIREPDLNTDRLSLIAMLQSEEERHRLAATNVSSLSGLRLGRQHSLPDGDTSTTNSSDVSMLGITREVRYRHAVKPTATLARKSAFTEHFAEHSFDGASEPSSTSIKRKNPLSTLVIPKTSLLSFRKRRSSTATEASTQSEPGSRSLDTMHSDKPSKRRESGRDSPDWACRTSLAIEAGKLSIDDGVSMRSQGSVSSQRFSEARRKSDETTSPESKERRVMRVRDSWDAHSSAVSDFSQGLPPTSKHSENVLQTGKRKSATCLPENSDRMEMSPKEEPSRRDSMQANSPMDLNKSLPALPPRESGGDDEE